MFRGGNQIHYLRAKPTYTPKGIVIGLLIGRKVECFRGQVEGTSSRGILSRSTERRIPSMRRME
jgi:hypothetical protein